MTVIEHIVYICAGHPLPPVILSPNRFLKLNLGAEMTVIEYIVYTCAGHPLPPVILSPNRSLKCKEYNLGWEVTSILTIIEYRLLFRPRQVRIKIIFNIVIIIAKKQLVAWS